MAKNRANVTFSYFFVTSSLLSGRAPESLFRYFKFPGVSGSVGPFAPHKLSGSFRAHVVSDVALRAVALKAKFTMPTLLKLFRPQNLPSS